MTTIVYFSHGKDWGKDGLGLGAHHISGCTPPLSLNTIDPKEGQSHPKTIQCSIYLTGCSAP